MKGWKKAWVFCFWALLQPVAVPQAGAVEATDSMTPAASLTAAPTPSVTPVAETPFVVLCYHRFIIHPKEKTSMYHVKTEEFRWQMQYLKDHGITPISMGQLKDHWFQGKPLPAKPVLLTFDDGFSSIYTKAFPILKEFGYPSVLFLYTGFFKGQGDSLKYSDIPEMQKAGMDVESHTENHMRLDLEAEKLSPGDFKKLLHKEFTLPLDFIEKKFGTRPTVLAYPYGVYNDEILKETKEEGYQLAFTVNPGPNDKSVDPYKLRRNLMLAGTSRATFIKMFESKVLHILDAQPGDGQLIESATPLISIKIQDGVDPRSVALQLESKSLKARYDPKTHLVSYQVGSPIRRGGHQMTLTAKDLDGNQRVYSWYFRVKRKPVKETKEEE